MPKLVFINKNFEEQQYDLRLEKTSVGRGNDNTLIIHDSSISLKHCEILVNGAEVIVRDLDSSNGTYVDGARLNKQSQARHGQVIRFGLVEARLELDPPSQDSETSASLTAVFDLAKYEHQMRRDAKQPKPASPMAKVEPSSLSGVEAEGKTVLMPRPAVSLPASQPGETTITPQREGRGAKTAVLVVVGLAILALIIWWFFFR